MYFPSAYLLVSRAFHFSALENRNFLSGWQINTSWPEIGLPQQCALLPPMQWFKPGSHLPQRRSGGFSQPAALTWCHATPSFIRLNFTQTLSVWFTHSAVHHCSALVCLGSAPAEKYLRAARRAGLFLYVATRMEGSCRRVSLVNVTAETVSNSNVGWNTPPVWWWTVMWALITERFWHHAVGLVRPPGADCDVECDTSHTSTRPSAPSPVGRRHSQSCRAVLWFVGWVCVRVWWLVEVQHDDAWSETCAIFPKKWLEISFFLFFFPLNFSFGTFHRICNWVQK